MKTNRISLLVASLSLIGSPHVSYSAIPQDLNVNGNLDINGTDVYLGSWAGDPARPGSSWKYVDGTPSMTLWFAHRPSNEWIFKHAGATTAEPYRWALKLAQDHQLFLYENIAVPSGDPAASIALNPAGASSFKYSVNLNGSKNMMPNQAAPAAADPLFGFTILNFALADARYIKQGTLSFGSGNSASNNGFAIGTNNAASGVASFAEGQGSRASGAYSIAMGSNSSAQGVLSLALGASSALGDHSIAIGESTATGWDATAFGLSRADDRYATAFGNSSAAGTCSTAGGASVASGQGATAFGTSTAVGSYSSAAGSAVARGDRASAFGSATATNAGATAFGYSTASGYGATASGYGKAAGTAAIASGSSTASGYCASSFGQSNVASGDNSTALGAGTTSAGYAQVVVGRYNIPNGNPSTWTAADDLFVVGNGDTPTAPSNAFVVRKNGDAAIKGKLEVTGVIRTTVAAGDILMFKAY